MMTPIKNNKIFEILKKMKMADFIYLSVLLLFVVTIVVIFFFVARFITRNINKVFLSHDANSTQTLNLVNYSLVAKKLNIPVNIPDKNGVVSPPPVTPVETPTPPAIPTPLDKKVITINILNSTIQKGLASILAEVLMDAGFNTPKTGKQKELYSTTTILIKESKKDYGPLILEAIIKLYPKAVVATDPIQEDKTFDVTIIIGEQ